MYVLNEFEQVQMFIFMSPFRCYEFNNLNEVAIVPAGFSFRDIEGRLGLGFRGWV